MPLYRCPVCGLKYDSDEDEVTWTVGPESLTVKAHPDCELRKAKPDLSKLEVVR